MELRRTAVSPETALASDLFDKFCSANTLKGILGHYRQLCSVVRIKPTHFPEFYPRLKTKLSSWRAQGLWSKFEKRASQKCYGRGKACYGTRVLIIGAGPCGLRAAIEAQLLGAKVVVVEKRDRFSRNNVLHLWPFVITDLKALGAKKFYGKFCAGSIDHISIRQLQCILLKVALLLGVEVHEGVGFEGLREPTENEGWRAVTSPSDHPVSHYTFDVLIGADGRRNTLEGFKRKALRAKLAIAITANFINKHTEAEARVKEISGVSYIFNQKFFQDLCLATGIDLENIVYYKDETHYFVMTAKKQSLLNKGVLLQDYADTAKLLSHENISTEALMVYALEAATFATDYQLPDIDFAVNHYGQRDVAMFDFTAMYAAENACRVVQKRGHKLLMTLVGDSLLEPFWPTGSGCARGFLSSFDACWMIRSWTNGMKSVLEVVAERESIYRLLGQTTPENLHKEHSAYTIDPHTRYPNLNLRLVMPFQVKSLYESDQKLPDVPDAAIDAAVDDKAPKKRRRDSVIAVDSLLCWLREQVACYNIQVIDVREAFVEGDVLCAVIHRFRPDLIEFPLPTEENVDPQLQAAFRNQLAFDILHQEYGLTHVMSGYDSVQFGSSDFLTLVAYLSQVYEVFRGEIPQTKYFQSEGDEEQEAELAPDPYQVQEFKHLRMAVTAKHHFPHKPVGRKLRLSSGRESREGDSESHRRHKKRRSEERPVRSATSTGDIRHSSCHTLSAKMVVKESRKAQDRMVDVERFIKSMRLLQLNERSGSDEEDRDGDFNDFSLHLYRQTVPDFDERKKNLELKLLGRESKPVFGKSLSESQSESDKVVHGLAKSLEAQFKGRSSATAEKQKPKDLIRAIGKIEKTDWNVQLIEKKIAEIKSAPSTKKERENKVPVWSREAYNDKRDAMKRKMDGAATSSSQPEPVLDDSLKRIGNKLKHGNTLDTGQRGCNKVSAMAEQLIHKLDQPKIAELVQPKANANQRPTFELPKKGKVDLCHFCKERVYVVERMTAEGKFFHRNCFRCEYCNTSLRIGNYVFDREGRYGERFYCSPHYTTVRLYGWKKLDMERADAAKQGQEHHGLSTPSRQILTEMDDRGTTPERVEFENSADFAEEDPLNEMDEDEWTDRNFGASNADNTSDEASDLSDEEEVTPEGGHNAPKTKRNEFDKERLTKQVTENSDSDTEVASEEESEDDDDEGEDEGGDEEEEDLEDCGGSTTEIETDSEFAEDPPNSVPGTIPTIIVDGPEPVVTKLMDSGGLNRARHLPTKETKRHQNKDKQRKFKDLYINNDIELVKMGGPERQLPVVTPVPKRWEPMNSNQERQASKVSIELKNKYLHGGTNPPLGLGTKKSDPAAQHQFKSVLDIISEQQKLLKPAPKPSATMQAFLEGAERLKNKTPIVPVPLNKNLIQPVNLNQESEELLANIHDELSENGNMFQPVVSPNKSADTDKTLQDVANSICTSFEVLQDVSGNEDDVITTESCDAASASEGDKRDDKFSDEISGVMTASDTPSFSTSENNMTNTVTVINVNDYIAPDSLQGSVQNAEVDSGSDTEVGSAEAYSDLDDLDDYDVPQRVTHAPPRVEIEDEFGRTKSMDPVRCEQLSSPTELERNMVAGLSSSDSSLNSGVFLETEMSEYIKEDSVAENQQKKRARKRMNVGSLQTPQCDNAQGTSKPQAPICVDLDSLDFADIDGMSSPDEFHCPVPGASSKVPGTKASGSRQQVYSEALVTSPSEDEERSSASSRDRGHQSTSNDEMSDNSKNLEAFMEAKLQNDVFTAYAQPLGDDRATQLGMIGTFSVPGKSIDDENTEEKSKSPKTSDVYSAFSATSSEKSSEHGFSSTDCEGESASHSIDCNQDSSSRPTSTDESNQSNAAPSTTRKLEEIRQERLKQNDLIRSMVLGRIKRSPDKTMRRNSKGSILQHSSSTSVEKSSGPESFEDLDKESPASVNVNLDSSVPGPSCNNPVSVKAYEPVFTCSPRFGSRPRIGARGPSKTDPLVGVEEQVSKPKDKTAVFSAESAALHRSMPNLAKTNPGERLRELNGYQAPPSYVDPPVPQNQRKSNPFLVSSYSDHKNKGGLGMDDFVNLHVKLRASCLEPGRSDEQGRSMYSDSSKDYSDSGYGHTAHTTSSAMTIDVRPRASTVADLNWMEDVGTGTVDRHFLDDHNPSTKSKAYSSETLVDPSIRRSSVSDVGEVGEKSATSSKRSKSKDRYRRRSLIQTFSDFFSKSPPSQNQTNMASATSSSPSNITSPTKDKFSLFKITPKLLQGKERRHSKSREHLVSPDASNKELDECARNMASMSISTGSGSRRGSTKPHSGRTRRAASRSREIQEIQLQLESIEADQRALESRGVKIEKRLRGEDTDDDSRSETEVMEEWFNLVREKTKLARFEKELLVRAQELELEMRREQLEEQLVENRLTVDSEKSPLDWQRENEIMHELRRIDDQHSHLLSSIHADMEKYNTEDSSASSTAYAIVPGVTRLMSDV